MPKTEATKRPTPKQVDRLAARFEKLKQKIKAEAEKLELPKEELIRLANEWGFVSRKAKKSYRLDGAVWYVLATYGQSSEVKKVAVQKLQLELVQMGCGRMFRNFFRPDVEYIASPEAVAAIKRLPHDCRRRVVKLYRQCFEIKPRAALLDVKKQKIEKIARRKAQKAS